MADTEKAPQPQPQQQQQSDQSQPQQAKAVKQKQVIGKYRYARRHLTFVSPARCKHMVLFNDLFVLYLPSCFFN